MIVGIKSGTFTLLGPQHIWALNECKRYCDYLIVLTNSDSYIQRKKGCVPISLWDRMYILRNIKCIDMVDTFTGDTEDKWIEAFYKNRLEKDFGKEAKLVVFHSDEMEGQKKVPGEKWTDDIIYIPKIHSPIKMSTTKIFETIRGKEER